MATRARTQADIDREIFNEAVTACGSAVAVLSDCARRIYDPVLKARVRFLETELEEVGEAIATYHAEATGRT